MDLLNNAIIFVPFSGILLLFIRSWVKRVTAASDDKVPKTECAIHVKHFKEALNEVNGDLKHSFERLMDKLDENGKTNIEMIKEVAKLSQRVEDLVKVNGKAN